MTHYRMYVTATFFIDPMDPYGDLWTEEDARAQAAILECRLAATMEMINSSGKSRGFFTVPKVNVLLVEA